MTIKLSDFILEQSISDASTIDIMLEQAEAELEVSIKLAEAYAKQLTMEYITDDGKEEVVTEAKAGATDASDAETAVDATAPEQTDTAYDDAKDSGKKVGNAVGNAAAKAGNKVAGFVKSIFGAIIGFFKGIGGRLLKLEDDVVKNGDKVAYSVAKMTDEQAYNLYKTLEAKYGENGARTLALYNPANTQQYLANLSNALDDLSNGIDRWIDSVMEGGPIYSHLFNTGRVLDRENDPRFKGATIRFDQIFEEFKNKISAIKLTKFENSESNVQAPSGSEFKANIQEYIKYYKSKDARRFIKVIREKADRIANHFNDWQRKRGLHYETGKLSTSYRGGDKPNYNAARELLSKVTNAINDCKQEISYISSLYENLKKCAANINNNVPGASANAGTAISIKEKAPAY